MESLTERSLALGGQRHPEKQLGHPTLDGQLSRGHHRDSSPCAAHRLQPGAVLGQCHGPHQSGTDTPPALPGAQRATPFNSLHEERTRHFGGEKSSVCVCRCVHTRVRVHFCAKACMCVHLCVHMCTCVRAHLCACTCVFFKAKQSEGRWAGLSQSPTCTLFGVSF